MYLIVISGKSTQMEIAIKFQMEQKTGKLFIIDDIFFGEVLNVKLNIFLGLSLPMTFKIIVIIKQMETVLKKV